MRIGGILLALAALSGASPVLASPDHLSVDTLGQAGAWSAFRASGVAGDALCGLDTVVDGRRLVSVELLSAGIAVRLFDPDWRFAPGTPAPLRAEIGGQSWDAAATGFGPLLEWRLDGESAAAFLAAFRDGRRLDLSLAGLGPAWRLSLAGSGAMLAAARTCAAEIGAPPPGRRWL